jgi:hypothetical protein
MEEKEIIQIVNKVYPKIVKYYTGDSEKEYKKGFPEIDHSWPNVYARYSQNVDMEGEDDASAEFVRKENKIYVYSDHIPNKEELVKAIIHEFVHFLQSESWMQRYYKSGGYEYHNHPYEVKATEEEKNWQKFI